MLQELQDGEVVGGGEILLDAEAARKKLREFQLANPAYYVLEFLKAAKLLGAGWFRMEQEGRQVVVEFDGERVSLEEWQEIYGAAFYRRRCVRTEALRHLALGLNAAQAGDTSRLEVEIGGEVGKAFRVGETIEELERHVERKVCTRILVERGILGSAFQRLWGALSGGMTAEEKALRQRGLFSPVRVEINGLWLPRERRVEEAQGGSLLSQGEGERREVGVDLAWQNAVIYVLQQGVLATTVQVASRAKYGVRAVVESDELRWNLSQSEFVQDEVWEGIKDRIDADSRRLLGEQVVGLRGRMDVGLALALFDYNQRRQEQGKAVGPDDERLLGALAKRMEQLPLFVEAIVAQGTTPEPRGLASFYWEEDGRTHLTYTTDGARVPLGGLHFRPVALLPKEVSELNELSQSGNRYLNIFRAMDGFGEVVSRIRGLEPGYELKPEPALEVEGRARRMEECRRSLWEIELTRKRLRAPERVEVAGLEVLIGEGSAEGLCETFTKMEGKEWRFVYVRDGGILDVKEVEGVALDVYMEIAGVEPNVGFSSAEPSKELEDAKWALVLVLDEWLEGRLQVEHYLSEVRAGLKAALETWLFDGEWPEELQEALHGGVEGGVAAEVEGVREGSNSEVAELWLALPGAWRGRLERPAVVEWVKATEHPAMAYWRANQGDPVARTFAVAALLGDLGGPASLREWLERGGRWVR